jgi:uncharacterized protein (TIGR00730 family)
MQGRGVRMDRSRKDGFAVLASGNDIEGLHVRNCVPETAAWGHESVGGVDVPRPFRIPRTLYWARPSRAKSTNMRSPIATAVRSFPFGERAGRFFSTLRDRSMRKDPADRSLPQEQRHMIRPPHPRERVVPLPNQIPKRHEEEPELAARQAAILSSPSYREAHLDTAFLSGPDARGTRLFLDYEKAETHLRAAGVEGTIVVFGSTRLREPARAEAHQAEALAALARRPDDENLKRNAAVAERLAAKSRYYEIAREFAHHVAESQKGWEKPRLWIMTGGGPGIMEAANRGAFEAGARSIGLNITLPHEQYPNPYIDPDLCFLFHYFAVRKLHFLMRARALVVFPGGYGTCDELFETLELIQTRVMKPVPVVLVGERYWRQALNIDFLADEGVIDPEDRDLFWYAESALEIWEGIQEWHRLNGSPLPVSRPSSSTTV